MTSSLTRQLEAFAGSYGDSLEESRPAGYCKVQCAPRATASRRASKATGYDFFAYDRVEIEESKEFKELVKRIEDEAGVVLTAFH